MPNNASNDSSQRKAADKDRLGTVYAKIEQAPICTPSSVRRYSARADFCQPFRLVSKPGRNFLYRPLKRAAPFAISKTTR
jgi:hypothetical protein